MIIIHNKYKAKNLIAILTTICVFFCCTINVSAAGGHISANTPETVNIGRSFTVALHLENDKPVKSVWIRFKFDSEYISFSKVDSPLKCDLYKNKNTGEAEVICLFKETVEQGDIINMTFTAKTGNDSSIQTIEIELVDAVTNDLEKADLSVDNSVEIYIERKSSLSQSDPVSRKSSVVSEKSTSSKKFETSSKKIIVSSQDKKESDNIHIIEELSDSDIESKYYTSSRSMSEALNYSDSRIKYILSGAGIAIAVIGILFGMYKLGETKSRSTYSELKNTNEKETEDSRE
ncbi:MAG: hypothetical protein IIZ46_02835 [Clostridia bacterium]|nr:hypothetical protein [Clostridia bacterium]